MNFSCENVLRYSFCALCASVAIGLCSYYLYKFGLDEELSVVHYTKFYETKDKVLPTVSLCFKNPFLQERLSEYRSNQTSYSAFLAGKLFSTELLRINYSYVTTNIEDYIKGYKIYFQNATSVKFDSGLTLQTKKSLVYNNFNGFLSWNDRFYKCFAFIIPPYKDLDSFKILISSKIFSRGIRNGHLRTAINLPKQLLLSGFSHRWMWPKKSKSSRYKTSVFVRSMDVVINRNKKNDKCNEYWDSYDDWVLKEHKKKTGCNTQYQEVDKIYEACRSQDKIFNAKFYMDIVSRNKYQKPCKTMQNIQLDWSEFHVEDAKDNEFGDFWFGIYFPVQTFKQIVQTR